MNNYTWLDRKLAETNVITAISRIAEKMQLNHQVESDMLYLVDIIKKNILDSRDIDSYSLADKMAKLLAIE